MKRNKVIFALIILLIQALVTIKPTFAVVTNATLTPTTKPSVSATSALKPIASVSATPSATIAIDDKIKELKDKLASRVAELNVVSQKLINGTIKTLSDEKIIVTGNDNEITFNVSENTKYFELDSLYKRKEVKVENFKVGQEIISWGAFSSSTNTLSTKNVYLKPNNIFLVGKVKGVDKKNYQVTVSDFENNNYTVDIEVSTKISEYNPEKGVVKAGFSKIAEGQTVYIYAQKSESEKKNLVSGNNIIILFTPKAETTESPSPTPTKSK